MFDGILSGELERLRGRLAADLEHDELMGRLGARVDLSPTTAGLVEVAQTDVAGLGDNDLFDAAVGLEQARRVLDAASVRVLAELDRRGSTDTLVGLRTGAWLADQAGFGAQAARAKVRLAVDLDDRLPEVIQALIDGVAGEQHARVLAAAAGNRRIVDRFLPMVPDLLTDAAEMPFDLWRLKISAIVTLLDQDGAEPDDDPLGSSVVSITRGLAGTWLLRGQLDAETGAVVHQALGEAADKLFHDRHRDEEVTPDLVAPSRRNLMAGALLEMCRRNLSARSGRGTAAEIILHLDAADPTTLIDGAGIPIGDTDRMTLMCDPLLRGVVFGMHRTVLDLGREQRLATEAQRRAMARRDGGCVFPGCDAPSGWVDAHHVVHWLHDGPTDLANLASLCRYHHGITHREGWQMGVSDDEWFWWITPTGRTFWSQRHGIRRSGAPPPDLDRPPGPV